jgi:hypothetical protein
MTDMQLLQYVKSMAQDIRGDRDSGNAYLMGYMWACMSLTQQHQIAESFRNELAEVRER